MSLQHITLITFGQYEADFLDKVVKDTSHEFKLPVKIKEGHLDLSDFYDPARRQYNGNLLLKEVDSMRSADSLKTVGLFNVDLFIPILTFIFGQAYLNGNTAIISIFRLNDDRYGLHSDEKSLYERTTKEVIHELGHTLGLIHCHNSTCVMRSSTYVEDLDQKNSSFCIQCKNEISPKLEI
jgi:archaemetzincin